MVFFFLAVFFLSAAIHLYASYKCDKKLRAATKGFIVLALLGWYCVTAAEPSWFVILALATSWLGDVLLIPAGTVWFTAGGVSFMVSHALFILAYLANVDFAAIPLWAIPAAAAIYITAVCFIFSDLKSSLPRALFYPMFAYLLINGAMNCFALYQLLSLPCLATAIVFIGAMLFFASDTLLFFVRFKKDTRQKSHFYVMLTYIFAEFLIVLGLILL